MISMTTQNENNLLRGQTPLVDVPIGVHIGARVKQLRERRGLSIRQLRDRVRDKGYDITEGAIFQLERGQTASPGIHIVMGIADVFGLTIIELIGLDIVGTHFQAQDDVLWEAADKFAGITEDNPQYLFDAFQLLLQLDRRRRMYELEELSHRIKHLLDIPGEGGADAPGGDKKPHAG